MQIRRSFGKIVVTVAIFLCVAAAGVADPDAERKLKVYPSEPPSIIFSPDAQGFEIDGYARHLGRLLATGSQAGDLRLIAALGKANFFNVYPIFVYRLMTELGFARPNLEIVAALLTAMGNSGDGRSIKTHAQIGGILVKTFGDNAPGKLLEMIARQIEEFDALSKAKKYREELSHDNFINGLRMLLAQLKVPYKEEIIRLTNEAGAASETMIFGLTQQSIGPLFLALASGDPARDTWMVQAVGRLGIKTFFPLLSILATRAIQSGPDIGARPPAGLLQAIAFAFRETGDGDTRDDFVGHDALLSHHYPGASSLWTSAQAAALAEMDLRLASGEARPIITAAEAETILKRLSEIYAAGVATGAPPELPAPNILLEGISPRFHNNADEILEQQRTILDISRTEKRLTEALPAINTFYSQRLAALKAKQSSPRVTAASQLEARNGLRITTPEGMSIDDAVKVFKEKLRAKMYGQEHLVAAAGDDYERMLLLETMTESSVTFLGGPGDTMGAHGEHSVKLQFAYALAEALGNPGGVIILPPIHGTGDDGAVSGSKIGYIDSDKVTTFQKAITDNSGDLYRVIDVNGATLIQKSTQSIVAGDGSLSDDKHVPHKTVIFVPIDQLDRNGLDFVAQLIAGKFPVRQSAGEDAVSVMNLNFHFVLAGPHLTGLLSHLDHMGQKTGIRRMTAAERLSVFQGLSPQGLWEELRRLEHNLVDTTSSLGGARTLPDAFMKAIPKDSVYVLQPPEASTAPAIVRQAVPGVLENVTRAGILAGATIVPDDTLVEFIGEYHIDEAPSPDEVITHVRLLVRDTFLKVIGTLTAEQRKLIPGSTMTLGVEPVGDGTHSLTVTMTSKDSQTLTFSRRMAYTEQDRDLPPIAPERMDWILSIPEQLRNAVFGIGALADRLGDAALDVLVNRRRQNSPWRAEDGAHVIGIIGMPGNGKTFTSRTIAEILSGHAENLIMVPLKEINSKDDLELKITGRGGEKSQLMRDIEARLNASGSAVVLLNELGGTPKEVQMALYELLDGKTYQEIAMGRVIILVDGNAFQDYFSRIAGRLPEYIQHWALQDLHTFFRRNPELIREFLVREGFMPAMLTRMDIHIKDALTYADAKGLTHKTWQRIVKDLGKTSNAEYWHLMFPSQMSYDMTIFQLLRQAYRPMGQGRELEAFLLEKVKVAISTALTKARVPRGTRVTIVPDFVTPEEILASGAERSVLGLRLVVDGMEPIAVRVIGKAASSEEKLSLEFEYKTKVHEAGHELTRQYYQGDVTSGYEIDTLPGLLTSGSTPIVYRGVQRTRDDMHHGTTKSHIAQRIAHDFGGMIGEEMVRLSGEHAEGVSNDMMHATRFAGDAILRFALVEELGHVVVPDNMTIEQFLTSQSEDVRVKFVAMRAEIMRKAKLYAEYALYQHGDNILALADLLSPTGKLGEVELRAFHAEHPSKVAVPADITEELVRPWREKWDAAHPPAEYLGMVEKLRPGVVVPPNMATSHELAEKRMRADLGKMSAPLPAHQIAAANVQADVTHAWVMADRWHPTDLPPQRYWLDHLGPAAGGENAEFTYLVQLVERAEKITLGGDYLARFNTFAGDYGMHQTAVGTQIERARLNNPDAVRILDGVQTAIARIGKPIDVTTPEFKTVLAELKVAVARAAKYRHVAENVLTGKLAVPEPICNDTMSAGPDVAAAAGE